MDIQNQVKIMKDAIGKVIIGKEKVVELTFIALVNKGHILLESVPGTGKTMLAKSFAKTIGGTFRRIQFTPDVLPSDVTGIQFFNPKEQDFQMRPGPVMTNILLADEINRATPRTQSSLLEVMEERQVTIDGETLALPSPFVVIATQNPVESQQGTFALPEAQMDRFFLQIDLGYPSFEEEKRMMHVHRYEEPITNLSNIFTKLDLEQMQERVKQVRFSEEVENYLLEIVHRTRVHSLVEVGVSPRGTLAFMRAAQGKAFISGREYVIPEDLKEMAPYVLSHRLVLSMEGSIRKTKQQILQEVLEEVEVPVEAGATQR